MSSGQSNQQSITFTHTSLLTNMKARFDGKCKSCGDDIRKGKEIAKNADEVWVHKHCVEELVDLP
ncbi:hypothetical protein OAK02_01360 [Candidatus Nitrosopelagicus sp.]|nr:hypothetical protein [Candidatus Nitrosopelagicus sp.]